MVVLWRNQFRLSDTPHIMTVKCVMSCHTEVKSDVIQHAAKTVNIKLNNPELCWSWLLWPITSGGRLFAKLRKILCTDIHSDREFVKNVLHVPKFTLFLSLTAIKFLSIKSTCSTEIFFYHVVWLKFLQESLQFLQWVSRNTLIFSLLNLTMETCTYDQHCTAAMLIWIFTELHVMQTRYCDENSVRLSVCSSVCPSVCHTRVLWQNGRKICPDLYTIRKNI